MLAVEQSMPTTGSFQEQNHVRILNLRRSMKSIKIMLCGPHSNVNTMEYSANIY